MSAVHEYFHSAWVCDFEFHQPKGEIPSPICMSAVELRTGEERNVWFPGADVARCPLPLGRRHLFLAYYASAELGCFLALGWAFPRSVIDLYFEFRCSTNGLRVPAGSGLLGACTYHGINAMPASVKSVNQSLAIRGGPYSDGERAALQKYCLEDVRATAELFRRMRIPFGEALHRGRYCSALAIMEHNGIPLDAPLLERLRAHWGGIQAGIIRRVDPLGEVYQDGSFRVDRFASFLRRRSIAWPLLPSGQLQLDDQAFRDGARSHPADIGPIRELRQTLGKMRLNRLPVGSDGRNRCLLSPFRSRTGRNQPSNSKFIFGPSTWLRSLIRPDPGRALAYIDWSQQEFAIAGALSGDAAMCSAYTSGDPYLTFAKQAGAVPPDATKQTHPHERGQFKVCALAVQYGMGDRSLSVQLGGDRLDALHLLRLHREAYPTYWAWSQGAVESAALTGQLSTVFGWQLRVGVDPNPRSLANFPCQANGAEILRLACCLIVERGVRLLAPIHDAVLIEADAEDIDEAVRTTQTAMQDAGRIVLDGFDLRTDADVVRYPERYSDGRGREFFRAICGLIPGGSADVNPHHTG